jgi:hypothetical protein
MFLLLKHDCKQDELCTFGEGIENKPGCIDWWRLRCGLKADLKDCSHKLLDQDWQVQLTWV